MMYNMLTIFTPLTLQTQHSVIHCSKKYFFKKHLSDVTCKKYIVFVFLCQIEMKDGCYMEHKSLVMKIGYKAEIKKSFAQCIKT